MAYATIADLSPEVGLYTCMVPMAVYAVLGGSRALSVSTTSTVASLTGSTLLAAGIAAASDDPAGDLAMLTLLVGLILLAARVLRLGTLIDNISEATVTGIKVGVGITVALSQFPKLLGIDGDPEASNVVAEVRGIVEDLGDISWTTAAFSALTLTVLLGLRRFAPAVPGPLVAVAIGIALVAFASLDEHGVALITPVPSGLPTPVGPSFDNVAGLLPGAFAIAIMCFLETASVAKAVRRSSEPPIDNDEELAANGVSCIAGAFFRAMPSAGGFSQTAINQRAGAMTQVSEMVTVLVAVSCALFLGDVLSDLPEATLSCMVIIAVLGLLQPAEFVRFWRLSKPEFWVAVITALTGLLAGMLAAVLVGVLLTLFLVIWELDHVGVTELRPTADGTDLGFVGEDTVAEPGLLVLRIDGPLYTANVRTVNRRILDAVDRARPGHGGRRLVGRCDDHRHGRHAVRRPPARARLARGHHLGRRADAANDGVGAQHAAVGGAGDRWRHPPDGTGSDARVSRALESAHGTSDRRPAAGRDRRSDQPGADHRHHPHARDAEGALQRPGLRRRLGGRPDRRQRDRAAARQ